MSLKGYAEETENKISGRLYEFEHDSDHYEFSAVDSETTDTADADTYGSFFIKGNFAESYKLVDGTPAYAVENGNLAGKEWKNLCVLWGKNRGNF